MDSRLTQGQRIEAAAKAAAEGADVCGYDSEAFGAAAADVLALCEMASAAERLAKAADALDIAHLRNCQTGDAAGHIAALDEFRAALAAWREGGQMSGAHAPRLASGRADGWDGLADGQSWATPPGPLFRAFVDPTGAASVYGSCMFWRDDFETQFPGRSGIGGGWAGIDAALDSARAHNAARAAPTLDPVAVASAALAKARAAWAAAGAPPAGFAGAMAEALEAERAGGKGAEHE